MRTVNIEDARTDLSRLVQQAADGDGFIIADAGKPMVKVVAVEAAEGSSVASRRIGFLHGAFTVPDDFDTIDAEEILEMFEGQD